MTTDQASKPFIYSERLQIRGVGALLALARFLIAFEFMLYGSRKFLHPMNIYTRIAEHGLPGEFVYIVQPWQVIWRFLRFGLEGPLRRSRADCRRLCVQFRHLACDRERRGIGQLHRMGRRAAIEAGLGAGSQDQCARAIRSDAHGRPATGAPFLRSAHAEGAAHRDDLSYTPGRSGAALCGTDQRSAGPGRPSYSVMKQHRRPEPGQSRLRSFLRRSFLD
jgi:hypothetical protein